MTSNVDPFKFVAEQMADPSASWSLGTFGAIAEFVRDADEPVELSHSEASASAVTSRGGIRVEAHDGMRLWASESTTRESWNHRIALCLEESVCAMSRRAVLTDLGPDADALRPADRGSILFDLGLDALQADLCIRVADSVVVGRLREHVGRSLFEPGNPAMGIILGAGPHRVFISRVGRVEVFQAIPPADGKSPEGPHTHVLPKLLMHKRTHPATELIPDGWIPCVHLYPAHPAKDAFGQPQSFDAARHGAFQEVLARFGDPELVDLKHNIIRAVSVGAPPSVLAIARRRLAKTTVRVALRQLQASSVAAPSLAAWVEMYERQVEEDEPNALGALDEVPSH